MHIFFPFNIIDFIIGFIIFIGILLGISYFHISRKSEFQNISLPRNRKIPYIAQSVFINIYAPLEEYDKYKYLFKANLTRNIKVINPIDNSHVFVPITTTNLPVYLYQWKSSSNLSSNQSRSQNISNNKEIIKKLKITIVANGIEQEINSNDIVLTTF